LNTKARDQKNSKPRFPESESGAFFRSSFHQAEPENSTCWNGKVKDKRQKKLKLPNPLEQDLIYALKKVLSGLIRVCELKRRPEEYLELPGGEAPGKAWIVYETPNGRE
jgi:hypothetical protein